MMNTGHFLVSRIRTPLLTAFALLAASLAAWAQQGVIDHSQGFAGETDLTLNGTPSVATINGNNLQITSAVGGLARSAYHTALVPVTNFQTRFNFHLLMGTTGATTAKADGMGFCIQGNGPTALGAAGGQMGYQGAALNKSVFIKFDNYDNAAGGSVYSATGIYMNGADPAPIANDINVDPTIDFQSEHDFSCFMNYDGTTLTVTLTDLTTNGTLTQTYTVNIASFVGANTGYIGFSGGTGGLNAVQEVMTWAYGVGPAPTNLMITDGRNQESLSWTAATGATSYIIFRSTTSGGPYTQVGTSATTNFVDNTAQFPNTYYYVVLAVSSLGNSLFSNQVTGVPLQPQIGVSPVGPITTSETGVNVVITLTVNAVPAAAGTITVNSSNTTGAMLGIGAATPSASIQFNVPSGAAAGTQYQFTVYGVDDFIANDPQSYQISFVVAGGGAPWTGATIPTINGTTLEGDTAGLVVNPTAGLATTTAGGQATFTVQLNSKPVAPVSISVTSSNPTEGTVSTGTLNFSNANWNNPQPVTVTGQGINLTYFNTPYTVNLAVNAGSDAAYVGMTATVSLTNIHLEVPPGLSHVWNGSGSSGGCGLTGAEVSIVLALAALARRRRRA